MRQSMRFRMFVMLSLMFACAARMAVAAEAPAVDPATTLPAEEETHFLRFIGDSKVGGKLQTADVIYRNQHGVTVRLISAVHIGESSYYHGIQKTMKDCDAVLYEMVKPKGSPAPIQGQHSDSAISQLQTFLKDQLNLSFQLDEIDYSPANFIHADLDAETFQQMQSDRGESFAMIMLQGMLKAMSDPGAQRVYEDEPVDAMDFLTRPDGEGQLKVLIGRRLGDIERDAMGLDMLNGTVILTERNKAVIKKLREVVGQGKKNIAIFYGAAHMTEVSQKLLQLGFSEQSTEWRTAWDVQIKPNAPSAFQKMLNKLGDSVQESAGRPNPQ